LKITKLFWNLFFNNIIISNTNIDWTYRKKSRKHERSATKSSRSESGLVVYVRVGTCANIYIKNIYKHNQSAKHHTIVKWSSTLLPKSYYYTRMPHTVIHLKKIRSTTGDDSGINVWKERVQDYRQRLLKSITVAGVLVQELGTYERGGYVVWCDTNHPPPNLVYHMHSHDNINGWHEAGSHTTGILDTTSHNISYKLVQQFITVTEIHIYHKNLELISEYPWISITPPPPPQVKAIEGVRNNLPTPPQEVTDSFLHRWRKSTMMTTSNKSARDDDQETKAGSKYKI